MVSVAINWWAIIVAALVNMVVGTVWYSKGVFGEKWAKLANMKMSDMGKKAGQWAYPMVAIGSLVQAYILRHFVVYAGAANVADGVVTGILLWLGFVAIASGVHAIFEGRPRALWAINAAYFLVVLAINGALLATWV